MSHPVARIVERLRKLSTTQLRIIYSTIAVLAFLWVSLVMLTHYLSISTHTDECLWTTENRNGRYVLVVESITPGGAADRAGIRPGDIVVAINGVRVDSARFEQFVSQHAQIALNMAPTGVPIPYVVARQGRLYELSVQLKNTERSIPQNLLRFSLPVVTLIWLLVGVMAILSQPHGTVQRRFFLAAASSVFAFMGTHFFENNALLLDIPNRIADILDLIQLVVAGFFFSVWLSFCASFPVDRSVFSTRWRKFLLWLPFTATLSVIVFAMLVPDQDFNQAAPSLWMRIILGLNSILIMLWISSLFTGFWLLYRGYRQLPEGANRKPMRIIVAGALMSGLVPLYIILISSIAQLLGASRDVSQWFLLPIILLPAFPVSFGYAIFKYQVMDFRRVVTTTAVYAATMTVIVAAYIGLGYAASQLFGAMSGRLGESLQIVGFIFFLLLFDPLKRQVQTAIENRFFPQHRDYSAHLVEFSEQASQMVESEAVARLITGTLVRTLDLSNAAVILWNQPHKPVVAARISNDEEGRTIDPASLNFLYEQLQQQRGLIALDTIAAPELATLRETYTYAIGLHVRDELRGLLLFDAPQDRSTLSSRKVHFVGSLATQGSTALETVHLLEREITRHRDLEELATARRIQQNILPTTLPDFPNLSISAVSNPAQSVGGDYFNVIPLDDDHVLVIVADVSGKGLPASFYMAELHGMVCIASTTCATPSQMLATINEHLHREMPRGTFITATALLFNTRNQQLSLARAGHTPLLYRNHSNITVFTPPGPALGFVRGGQFTSMIHEHRLSYSAGDTFILYSDGVSEMMNTSREEYGDVRLQNLVGTINGEDAAAIRDRIVGEVEGFRNGAEQHDDMTVVVIQVNRGGSEQNADVDRVVASGAES